MCNAPKPIARTANNGVKTSAKRPGEISGMRSGQLRLADGELHRRLRLSIYVKKERVTSSHRDLEEVELERNVDGERVDLGGRRWQLQIPAGTTDLFSRGVGDEELHASRGAQLIRRKENSGRKG